MPQAISYESEIKAAASEVLGDCPHALPPLSDLVTRLSAVDQHRDELLKMVHVSSRYMQNMITSAHHHLLLEFTAIQAAKAGIKQEELVDEICMRYNVVDMKEIQIRDFWEVMKFSWNCVEGQTCD